MGIDLAGNPKNDTGLCILEANSDKRVARTEILHSDSDILKRLLEERPDIIAIDAPLTFAGENRFCDKELQSYGALPVTLRGMEVLARRGTQLAEKLKKENLKFIEVFATASAKILGLYDKSERIMQKNLINANISGDVNRRFLTKDELDSIFSAITGYLYLNKSTHGVGDESERIVIPRI